MKFKYQKKRNIFKAFLYSINGVKAAWRNEIAFRQEVVLFISSIPFAVLLGDSLLQIVALLGVLLFVIVVELLNSAIETVINRISTDYHILSGRAKDMSSAAVLGALLIAAFTWVSILIENIFL
ncbi:diacylglycerol kinase [Candidatus Pelagibacter sp.]|nr:diacylglycerol kinase [Candidatus Pelagibacter sp.]|tara:strand:+ start:438 stop:809 length:372 start_codon:yes stop_codon:yes gene_type:complete